jgi:hypothetical protein
MNRELEKFRQDANNRRYAGLVYHCVADPRLIVPMRVRRTGYAMNFAHSPAIPVLAAILLALLAPLALPFVFSFPPPPRRYPVVPGRFRHTGSLVPLGGDQKQMKSKDPNRQAERYKPSRAQITRMLEKAAFGHEVGLNGFTTLHQAEKLADYLGLDAGGRLLDIGAGLGWLGSHVAHLSGCRLVSTDIPWDALVTTKHLAGMNREVAGAAATALPFCSGSFDAVIHADVFC